MAHRRFKTAGVSVSRQLDSGGAVRPEVAEMDSAETNDSVSELKTFHMFIKINYFMKAFVLTVHSCAYRPSYTHFMCFKKGF